MTLAESIGTWWDLLSRCDQKSGFADVEDDKVKGENVQDIKDDSNFRHLSWLVTLKVMVNQAVYEGDFNNL